MAVAVDANLDAIFAALADPTRRDIVGRLSHGDATLTELAGPYDMTLQAVSQHVQVLERCGLVSRGRHRQTRPCRLETRAMEAATSWLEESRRVWSDRLDRLDGRLAHLQEGDQR